MTIKVKKSNFQCHNLQVTGMTLSAVCDLVGFVELG